jgi:lysine 2,3-aminomutase
LIAQLIEVGIQRLRIHSRMPVTLPQRIDDELSQALGQAQRSLTITLITHFNHPKELSDEVVIAAQRLRAAGLTLLNQSVLLRGVNDEPHTLRELSYGLSRLGVIPYYLHHPDLTRGTHHFRRSLSDGLALYRQLRGQLSGYLIPRYVIEIPGGGGKVEVDSGSVQAGEGLGEWWFKSPLTQELYHYFDLAHE